MRYRLLFALGLFITPVLFAQKAPDSISLGGYSVSIGMPRDQVLAGLASYLDISGKTNRALPCEPDAEECWLWTKTQPVAIVGSLGFKNGRVASVLKYWDPNDQQQAAPFARAVYGAISSLVRDGNTNCRLSVNHDDSPRTELKSAHITCEGRTVDISILRYNGVESAMISESLK